MHNPKQEPTLHLICGRIAAGKSTLATRLGEADNTVVIREDDWLAGLYGDQMATIQDYLRCAARLRSVVGPHVRELLNAGMSVVLDFQANTIESRAWMRGILDTSGAAHVLHLLDVSEEQCLARLRARNAAGDHPFAVTEAQFHQISRHFMTPQPDEGFNVEVHRPRAEA
ncbi:cell division protein ZipA [Oceanicola sp. 22II-s10i]|uniref:AAA family ATPase n=1 Tax=Oceanicola sp. 22II-s10i TaxID=1317116 RepID=UPI000B527362|nr:ATP-binding protein [Oceanicola sp. 22II-s10i]OWU86148.1 cell division protein ZipA [Oceanicola sp. 22II-s10i]